jgi:hypothetical protein
MVIKDETNTEIAPGNTVAWATYGGRMRKGVITKIILRNTYNQMSVIVRPLEKSYPGESLEKRRVVHFVKV